MSQLPIHSKIEEDEFFDLHFTTPGCYVDLTCGTRLSSPVRDDRGFHHFVGDAFVWETKWEFDGRIRHWTITIRLKDGFSQAKADEAEWKKFALKRYYFEPLHRFDCRAAFMAGLEAGRKGGLS